MNRIEIKDFMGMIKGYIEIDNYGKKTVKDFYGKILGYYDPRTNQTTDFFGRILANGDISASLFNMNL